MQETFRASVVQDERTSGCAIPLPFDPKEHFGRARAPVVVTLGAYSYRSTTATLGGVALVPLARVHREAAGLAAGDRVEVTVAFDSEERTVEMPRELARALTREPGAKLAWKRLSYTHQREYAEWITSAKKPETRSRRVEKTLAELRAR